MHVARILIVEDDANIRLFLAAVLSKHGYTIVEAGDGAEALRCLHESADYYMLITDLLMPNVDGLTLIKSVQQQFPDLLITAITADIRKGKEALKGGAHYAISKPISYDRLVSFIQSVVKEGASSNVRERTPKAPSL